MERLAGRVILLWGWQRWLAALGCGALAALALAPVDFFAACFIAFPVLVWLLDGAEGRPLARLPAAFAIGWWFGLGYFLAGMWWLIADAQLDWTLPLLYPGLPALLALSYGLATLVARLLWSEGAGRIAALAFGFGLAEWLRAALLSGFAWNAIGYAAMPVPLFMQAAQLIGVFGMSALAVFVFSVPALLAGGRRAGAGLALAGALAALVLGYGALRPAAAPEPEGHIALRVVQPGIAEAQSSAERLDDYLALSHASGEPQLIVWPRQAIPLMPAERPDLLEALGQALGEEQMLLAGTLRGEGDGRLYDAMVAIDGEGTIVDAADRVHLPTLVEPAALGVNKAYAPGNARRLLPVPGALKALPLIGEEAVIPGIAAREAEQAALIVMAADHGRHAAHQYVRQAQLRAVEAGIPAIVAAPDGASAAIDSHGRIIDALAPGVRGALDVTVATAPAAAGGGHILSNGLLFIGIFGIFALLLSIRGQAN